ncbi:MAG: hypothetical protein MK098_08325 [Marinovum sp.]|nr:hypothetical protein [Marinovum sp.]
MSLAFLVSACEAPERPNAAPSAYLGISTRLLKDDLVGFQVIMQNATATAQLEAYARCAAAQYALIRGYGFARHVRTTVSSDASMWTGDAIYVISATLPRGVATIDAEVTVAACREMDIPTV